MATTGLSSAANCAMRQSGVNASMPGASATPRCQRRRGLGLPRRTKKRRRGSRSSCTWTMCRAASRRMAMGEEVPRRSAFSSRRPSIAKSGRWSCSVWESWTSRCPLISTSRPPSSRCPVWRSIGAWHMTLPSTTSLCSFPQGTPGTCASASSTRTQLLRRRVGAAGRAPSPKSLRVHVPKIRAPTTRTRPVDSTAESDLADDLEGHDEDAVGGDNDGDVRG